MKDWTWPVASNNLRHFYRFGMNGIGSGRKNAPATLNTVKGKDNDHLAVQYNAILCWETLLEYKRIPIDTSHSAKTPLQIKHTPQGTPQWHCYPSRTMCALIYQRTSTWIPGPRISTRTVYCTYIHSLHWLVSLMIMDQEYNCASPLTCTSIQRSKV